LVVIEMLRKPPPNLTEFTTTLILAIVIGTLVLSVPAWSQTSGILSPKEEKPTPTVKVEVKDAEGKKPAEVKVEVGGKQVETKTGEKKGEAPSTILPNPEKGIAPVDTKRIDEAGKQVGEKIDDVAEKSSHVLGNWVLARGFQWYHLAETNLDRTHAFDGARPREDPQLLD
jgi:hypothetical protein